MCLDACARQALEFGILLAFPADFSQQAVSVSHRWKFFLPHFLPSCLQSPFPRLMFQVLGFLSWRWLRANTGMARAAFAFTPRGRFVGRTPLLLGSSSQSVSAPGAFSPFFLPSLPLPAASGALQGWPRTISSGHLAGARPGTAFLAVEPGEKRCQECGETSSAAAAGSWGTHGLGAAQGCSALVALRCFRPSSPSSLSCPERFDCFLLFFKWTQSPWFVKLIPRCLFPRRYHYM